MQYFERNRFEYHPENQGRYQVLLGLLGSETLTAIGAQVRAQPVAQTPNYAGTSPDVAALPREGLVGTTFKFIFVGLRPNTEYAILIATDSSPAQRVATGDFRTDSNGRLSLEFDSSSTPPGSYLVGAFDGNGRLVVSASFWVVRIDNLSYLLSSVFDAARWPVTVFPRVLQIIFTFVFPLAQRAAPRHATFTTLLMSTGLTFGTISSLYGLNAGIIDETQFSLLVTVVVLSAVVPTAIAERWFLPDGDEEKRVDRRSAGAQAEEYV